jgi:hypothetical protein
MRISFDNRVGNSQTQVLDPKYLQTCRQRSFIRRKLKFRVGMCRGICPELRAVGAGRRWKVLALVPDDALWEFRVVTSIWPTQPCVACHPTQT